MAGSRVRQIEEADIETLLGEDVCFEGEMQLGEPVLLKGMISGNIVSEGQLFIGETAMITADITAQIMSVKGNVKGELQIGRRLELFSSARLEGKIVAADLIVESGARIEAFLSASQPQSNGKDRAEHTEDSQ